MENDTTVTSSEDTAPGAKPDKGLIESARLARKWTRELGASKKWMERFRRGALKCEKAFLDDDANAREGANDGKVNLFWSNVQVVLSAIYGRLPQAEVDRKFKDFDDDVSRVAGMILQRILNGDIAREHDDTAAAMRDGVQDRFVVGLGQVWARYDVETEEYDEPVLDPMTGQPAMDPATGKPQTQKAERIINEEAEVDYVYWDDFRYSPCRRWRDCRWVARRVYMSEARLKKRFKLTPAQLQMIPMTTRTPDENPDDDVLKATPFKQAAVWEIWDKDDNTACWFVEGCTFVLDTQPDPLELEDFFPCPQPVVATTLTKAFRPRADYAMAQDLYRSLDRINARIETLTDAIRAAGVYDKNAGSLKQLLSSNVENALVPTDNWSSFIEKGGMKGVMDWMPIEQFANALAQLQQRKAQIERDLYEVLGISDIMRGASVASETATAQQLKVQYGGARLSNLQNDVARFVSGVMRIRANIVCNHFQRETLIKRSLIDRTPDAQYMEQAIEMLKNFGTAMFSITVTADSLAAPDWQAEKEARTEFMGAASNYLMAAAPLAQQNPMAGSFLLKLLQWGAAGFRGSKSIEGVLDQAARQLEQQAQQPPPPPPPSPKDQKDSAAAAKLQAEADRTSKETALMPNPAPAGIGPGGPQPGPPQGLPAPPGSVAPMQPQMPAPVNSMPM